VPYRSSSNFKNFTHYYTSLPQELEDEEEVKGEDCGELGYY
jgi:hypothetical protein